MGPLAPGLSFYGVWNVEIPIPESPYARNALFLNNFHGALSS
jgi:hypothetical protein